MSSDPRRIVVTQCSCNHCGVDAVEVYHQSFPEMRISSTSAQLAAERLSIELETELATVSDAFHRDPVKLAIADVRAFLRAKQVECPTEKQ